MANTLQDKLRLKRAKFFANLMLVILIQSVKEPVDNSTY